MTARFRHLLLLSLLALLVAAVPARAGFAPANDPIVEAEQLAPTGLDTDAQGNTVVAWSQQKVLFDPFEVKARRVAADGTLGPIIEVAPGEVGYRPAVAVTPGGRAFVAWRENVDPDPDSIKGRWLEPDGTLGPILTLVQGAAGVEDAGNPQAVVDLTGDVTIAWQNFEANTLEMRRVTSGGTLYPLVEDVAEGSVTNPVISALPSGSTVAVWRGTGTEKSAVSPEGVVSPAVQISESAGADDNEIATSAAGRSLVVWRQSGAEYAVRGRMLRPNGAPIGPELTIEPPGAGFVGPRPTVAADSAGNFLVTWNRQDGAGDAIVYARGLDSAGVFAGPAQAVSSAGADAGFDLAALVDGGNGFVAWEDDSPGEPTLGRTVNASGVPTAPAGTFFSDGFGPELVSSVPAAGFAAFTIGYPISGSAQGIVLRRFLTPPSCTDSAAKVVQGQPIAVPISCAGLGIEGAQVAAPPVHGTVSGFNPLTGSFTYTPRPGYDGPDSFTYTAANDGGPSAPAIVSIDVGKETVKPVIKRLRYIRKGKKFRLVLSEPAKAVIRVKSVRRVKGKRRIKLIGKVVTKNASIKATIRVRGKLAKRLAAGGKFRAIGVATDLAENKSNPKRIAFRLNG